MSLGVHLGRMFQINAIRLRGKCALRDRDRSFNYEEVQKRVEQLGASLCDMGLEKGDRFGVLMENSIEFVEIYLAAAQTGLIVVPVNFMLVANEVEYILSHSEAKAIIVDEEFTPLIDSIREKIPGIPEHRYVAVGENPVEGYQSYNDLVAGEKKPVEAEISGSDPWIMLYTSGTTGTPKGVIRSHNSYTAFYLINAAEFYFNETDIVMNVMPLFHVNSTFYTLNVLYVGGSAYIHPARRFKALELLEVIDRESITFISLIPTHYQLVLEVSKEKIADFDFSSLQKLLCSSAPAFRKTKLAIMELFPNVKLYEAYGSTEAGLVTILRPHEQLEKIGSIGREAIGTDRIRILNQKGDPVPTGEVGEIFSKGPMLFDEYYKMPEKTKESFRDGWFSASDMGKQDEEGYFYIVDRKDNMIITGGEKVFPKEIEAVLVEHPLVFDAAVVGTPDQKWGEVVTAVVVPSKTAELTEKELIEYCDGKMGKFKRPKCIIFIDAEEMPRTMTGKILHRKLRGRFGGGK